MSAHRKRGERDAQDYYPSDATSVATFARLLPTWPGMSVLEPSAGDGAWIRGMDAVHPGLQWDVVELTPDRYAPLRALADAGRFGTLHAGAFEHYLPVDPDGTRRRYDLIVGNPPYSLAAAHAQHALFLARPGGMVALLLRSGFAHTSGRADFIARFPPWREYALVERPSMDGSGNVDATEYVVFVWVRGYAGDTIRRYVSWKDPRRAEAAVALVRERDWPAWETQRAALVG